MVRDKSGLYQFAFQEVNRVESMMRYDYDRLRHLGSWGYRFGQPTLVEMNPADFLKIAPLRPALTSESSLESIHKGIKDGAEFDTPFIDIDEESIAVSHEGRHRALVLIEMGEEKMPVIIYDRRLRDHDWKDYESADVKRAVRLLT